MKTILGLDLGTNSIGWALVEVDETNTPVNILGMGSRIVPLGSSDREQFCAGQTVTKNQDRTKNRTQRKGYDRKQDRKLRLEKILKHYNMFPTSELFNLSMLDLWKLRADAANPNSNISPQQLGRVLYMLNQKRGYKSARSEASLDKKDTDYVQAVKGRYAQLKEANVTLGQYFFGELQKAKVANSYFRIKEKVYPREAYIEEFDTILKVQRVKHSFLNDELINQLRDSVIFFQRKLKSQKGLVSVCEFECFEKTITNKETKESKTIIIGPRVAPKTSPVSQLCRIWEAVNNLSLKVKSSDNGKNIWQDRIPSFEEKQEIAEYLFTHENLSFDKLLKILNLRKNDVYANKQILKGIKGNEVYDAICNIIGASDLLTFDTSVVPSRHESILIDESTGEILEEKESLEIASSIESQPFYQLWHTIYSIKDLEECKNALQKKFDFPEEIAERLSRLDFNKQGFGNKSTKAMRKILPYLMLGYNYPSACSLAGYNHSSRDSNRKRGIRTTSDELNLLPKNSLRQPVVEKILNQMIHVVNAVIKKHGKPSEIRIELARELKQSKDERNETELLNVRNQKLHEEIGRRLQGLGLPVTKKYIQKFKLIFPSLNKSWKDALVCNECIYCGETFNLTEALLGDAYDIDHIVPRALLFDDSQTNKVLVHRNCNSSKTNLTAYDYISTKGELALQSYLHRVDDWFKRGIISYSKMQRLKVSHVEYLERKKQKKVTETDKKLWESFIDRQLRETQYIARKSREILQKICPKVTATEGGVTAKLRELWGWDDVLMNLQMPKYKELGQTIIKEWTSNHGKRTHQKEEIINWSKRDDHRHHAIDALVIACTKQGFIQRINTLNASDTKDEMRRILEKTKNNNGGYPPKNALENNDYQNRITLLDEYLRSQRPPLFTTKYVEQEAAKILISYKAGKRVVTRSKLKAVGKNKEQGVLVPRGPLHEQSVYGKIKTIENDKPLKYLFQNVESIVSPKIKSLIEERISEYDNNRKLALQSITKKPIYLNPSETKVLEKASCYVEATVLKYKLQNLTIKQVEDIVDEGIKTIITTRLQEVNNKTSEAFKSPLWLNEEKQIPIHTVRIFARPDITTLQPIKRNEHGEAIGFVVTGNNHHIAIYEDSENKLFQHTCTFWHAVERKKYNIPYIIKDTSEAWNTIIDKQLPESFLNMLPADNLILKLSLQQNEMFILGLSQEELKHAIEENDKVLLSKHLYLVWSISSSDYWFRHHLETKNTELKTSVGAKESKRYYRFQSIGSLMAKNPTKVRLNHLGEITKVGE